MPLEKNQEARKGLETIWTSGDIRVKVRFAQADERDSTG